MRRGWDSNPRRAKALSGFRNRRTRPLCDLSLSFLLNYIKRGLQIFITKASIFLSWSTSIDVAVMIVWYESTTSSTSFWFFLSSSEKIENLVVTYSTPERYFEGTLASEPQDWAVLPGFQKEEAPPTPKCIRVIVGVGFLPFRLPDLLKHDYQGAEVTLVLPFPPGPPQFQRNWRFIHEIEKTCPLKDERQIIRIDAQDASRCFDHLCSLTKEGVEDTVLAPFGPKPHSLGMCLFAIKYNCDVYYTQPTHYHPEYSTGMKMRNGKPDTTAYAIKLNGKILY